MVHGRDCCNRRAMMWPNSGFPGCFPHPLRPDLPRIMPWRASIGPKNRRNLAAPMTMSVANIAEDASPMRGLLPLWVGVLIYALFLVAGNRLLIDPDTMWQITVGQWISDHRAVPETDVYSFTMRGQPWISTQWLSQVLYAKDYAAAGWSGPVVLAAAAIDGAVGQSAWRLCVWPRADRADRARCCLERRSEAAEVADAAMGGIRCGGAGAKLRHALWLEFAAGVTENPWPRWRAAADHGMEACGFRQRRRARGLPAAGNWTRAVSRRQTAAAAHRAAAGIAAHGARPGTCCRNSGAAGAPGSRGPARQADRRHRGFKSSRRAADARRAVHKRRRRAGGGNLCLCVDASLRAAHARFAGRRGHRAEAVEPDTGVQRLRFRRLPDRQRRRALH